MSSLENEFKPGPLLFSLCALAVSVMLLREALRVDDLGMSWGGPRLFPCIISSLLFITSVVLVLLEGKSLLRLYRGVAFKRLERVKLKEIAPVAFLLVIVVLYVEIIKIVGYLIPTFMISLYVSLLFKARLLDAVMISLIASLGSMFLFKIVLAVPLPEGVIGW